MKIGRRLDLKAQAVSWILAQRSDQMSRMADRLFREICADPVLEQYIVSLPLGGLPEIRRALTAASTQSEQEVLLEVIHTAMKRDWRQLSPAAINRAAHTYVCCLKPVLLHYASVRSASEHNLQTSPMAHQVLDGQR